MVHAISPVLMSFRMMRPTALAAVGDDGVFTTLPENVPKLRRFEPSIRGFAVHPGANIRRRSMEPALNSAWYLKKPEKTGNWRNSGTVY
jgi:hypothetical protein